MANIRLGLGLGYVIRRFASKICLQLKQRRRWVHIAFAFSVISTPSECHKCLVPNSPLRSPPQSPFPRQSFPTRASELSPPVTDPSLDLYYYDATFRHLVFSYPGLTLSVDLRRSDFLRCHIVTSTTLPHELFPLGWTSVHNNLRMSPSPLLYKF